MPSASVIAYGDSSVGIHGLTVRISELPDFGDVTERTRARELLMQAFAEILDETPDVVFSDECPDCLLTVAHKRGCPMDEPPSHD